jgi:magnesium-dependent phosphatase-1
MPLNVTEKKRKRQEEAAAQAIAKAAKTALEGATTSERGQRAEQELSELSELPNLVVFDLDDTLWIGDIDMTSGPPFSTDGPALPVLAKKGGHGDKVVPLPDVPEIFDWLEIQGIKFAVSTHSYKPKWAEEVLNLLETTCGTKYADLLALPIGEVQKKTKDVHLKAISAAAGCACADMVFFDDKDHNVHDGKKVGVTSVTTKDGLNWDKFVECLRNHEAKKTGTEPVPQAAPMPKAVITPRPVVAAPRPVGSVAAHAGWRPAWAVRPQISPPGAPAFNPRLAAAAFAARGGYGGVQ